MTGQEWEGEGLAIWHLDRLLVIFISVDTQKAIVVLHAIISLISFMSVLVIAGQKLVFPVPNNRTRSFP